MTCHHASALGLFAHYNISVTDQPCSWSAPKQNKTSNQQAVQTIDELYPPKTQYRASKREVSEEEIETLRKDLSTFGGAVGLTWLLNPDTVPKENHFVVNVADIIFSSEYQNADDKFGYFTQKISVPTEQITKIAEKTTGQIKNPTWLMSKNLRLTASSFGMVLASCKRNRFPQSLFKKLKG